MILTNRFFDTFDTVFDVINKADYYGNNLTNTEEITNLELALPGFSKKDLNKKGVVKDEESRNLALEKILGGNPWDSESARLPPGCPFL